MQAYSDRVAGAQVTMANFTIGTTLPTMPFVIFRGSFAEAEPRVLRLGNIEQPRTQFASFWPPSDRDAFGLSYVSGLISEAGELGNILVKAACYLRYGALSVSDSVVFDWRVGTYNLPPCDYVEVGVMCWGTGWATVDRSSIQFSAVTVPGQMEGALVPTCSDQITIPTANTRNYSAPRKACAMDLVLEATGFVGAYDVAAAAGSPQTTGASATIYRDEANFAAYPPWSPVLITPTSRQVLVVGATDTTFMLRYFLQL